MCITFYVTWSIVNNSAIWGLFEDIEVSTESWGLWQCITIMIRNQNSSQKPPESSTTPVEKFPIKAKFKFGSQAVFESGFVENTDIFGRGQKNNNVLWDIIRHSSIDFTSMPEETADDYRLQRLQERRGTHWIELRMEKPIIGWACWKKIVTRMFL